MADVLEEVTSQEIDRSHVTRRVEDWANRIGALYQQITEWLPAGWTADRTTTLRMHEVLMKKYDVLPRELPVLRLFYRGTPSGRIEPRVLWIVGENGRLDFIRGSNHYIIIDTAENFAPPDWRIAPLTDRRNLQKLGRDSFNALL
jgi:hypothetical protein